MLDSEVPRVSPTDYFRRIPRAVWDDDFGRDQRDKDYCRVCHHNVLVHNNAPPPWTCSVCDCSGLEHARFDAYLVNWLRVRGVHPRVTLPRDVEHAVLARDGMICRYCGCAVHRRRTGPRKLQLDHVLPHSLGGRNTVENLVVSCRRCNYAKKDDPTVIPAGWIAP